MDDYKRMLWRSFNFIALILILYNIVFEKIIYVSDGIIYNVVQSIDPTLSDAVIVDFIYNSGYSLIAAATLAVLSGFLLCAEKPSFKRNNKMSIKTFLLLVAVMETIQVVSAYAFEPLNLLISSLGYSTDEAAAVAGNPSVYFSGLVYSVIVAPIAEELFCRGLLLSQMKKYGEGFAIIMSALMFGLIHMNIIQFPVTFAMGILFGITAVRYSLGAAILLHMFNNIYVEVIGNIYIYDIVWIIVNIFVFACLAVTAFAAAKNRNEIKEYIKEAKPDGGVVKSFFTAPFMLCTIAYFLLMTLLSVTAA